MQREKVKAYRTKAKNEVIGDQTYVEQKVTLTVAELYEKIKADARVAASLGARTNRSRRTEGVECRTHPKYMGIEEQVELQRQLKEQVEEYDKINKGREERKREEVKEKYEKEMKERLREEIKGERLAIEAKE